MRTILTVAAVWFATILLARYGLGAVATYMMASCLITVVATWFLTETHRVKLDDAVPSPVS